MAKLLQFSVYGIKNINKEITINLSELSLSSKKKPNNLIAIFGYNGSGKTALISAIRLYTNIILKKFYLVQDDTKIVLSKLINYETKHFKIKIVFKDDFNSIFKHIIEIKDSKVINEEISIPKGRTLNENFKPILSTINGKLYVFDIEKNKVPKNEFENIDYSYGSFVSIILSKLYDNDIDYDSEYKELINVLLSIVDFAKSININMFHGEELRCNSLTKESVERTYKSLNKVFERQNCQELSNDQYVIEKNQLENFEKETKNLEKFINIFKPELKDITLDIKDDGVNYRVKRMFNYGLYSVDEEYESSGIKQLVSIFVSLLNSAKGQISFIDEMDTNLNSVYLVKLLEFFKEYGDGQLIFTTHNLEVMDILKNEKRSIVILGNNNNIDLRTKQGNASPKSLYTKGFFPNSPMNIEGFDFLSVFLGE